MLTCAGCSKLARCPHAPKDMSITTHTCDEWETTSHDILRARGHTYRTFGPIARQGFTKEKRKALMLPADIIAAVQNGDVAAIEALRGKKTPPSHLMLCAAKLTGDAAGIAAQLKSAKSDEERADILLGILEAKAVIAQERAAEPDPEPEPEPAPKPKRRRTPRKKPAPSAEDIEKAKEAEKAEEVSEKNPPAVNLDVDLIMLRLNEAKEANDALMAQVISMGKALEAANERAEHLGNVVSNLSAQQARTEAKLTLIKNAFVGFEIGLIGSGTLDSTPFADETADWNKV